MFSPFLLSQQHWCATDSINEAQLKNNLEFRLQVDKFEEAWRKDQVSKVLQDALLRGNGLISFAYNPPYEYNVDKNKIYTIPVVFHIIHPGNQSGEESHPTDSQIKSLLKYVNEVYAGIRPNMHGPREGGVFAPIQFALAKKDESNNPTTGIVHINGS